MKRLFFMFACVVLLAACEKEPLNVEIRTDLQSEESLESVINNRVSQGVAVERAIAAINGLKERAETRATALKVAKMDVLLNSRLYKKFFGVKNLQHIIIFAENNFKILELEVGYMKTSRM